MHCTLKTSLTFFTRQSPISRETIQTGALRDVTITVLRTWKGTVLSVISREATQTGSLSDVTETVLRTRHGTVLSVEA